MLNQEDMIKQLLLEGCTQLASTAMVSICRAIYKKMTELPEYNPEEFKRYETLVRLYRTELCRPSVPIEWAIEGRRPLHTTDLSGLIHRFSEQTCELHISDVPICESVKGMLTTITALMSSLSHRTVGKIQAHSIEGLFFAELACLLAEKLPSLSYSDPKTLLELKKIESFCQNVHDFVLIPDRDIMGVTPHPRNNPIAALKDIMSNLKGTIERTTALIQATTLNQHLEKLDNTLTAMAAQSFHTLYLFTAAVFHHESILPVPLFLDIEQTHNRKMTRFKAQRLARWLEATLRAVSVVDNSFSSNHDIEVTLEMANHHLDGECPSDSNAHLPEELRDSRHAHWGHWGYSVNDRAREEIEGRLTDTRDAYRNILKIYHLRQMVSHIRKVAPVSGESWLYGDRTGLAMINILMLATEELSGLLSRSLTTVYSAHHDIFEMLRQGNGIQATDPAYSAHTKAITQFKAFESHSQEVPATLRAIKAQCDSFESRAAGIAESKRKLLQELVTYLELEGKTDLPEYETLRAALHDATPLPKPIATAPGSAPRLPLPVSSGIRTALDRVCQMYLTASIRELDLSACHLGELSREELTPILLQFKLIPDRVTHLRLSHNGFHTTTRTGKIALSVFGEALSTIPSSIKSLDLQGNGFEKFTEGELKKLLGRCPKTAKSVSLVAGQSMSIQDQLERVRWPESYYALTLKARGLHDVLAGIVAILSDYTKDDNTLKRIVMLHWCRHHVVKVQELVKKIGTTIRTPDEAIAALHAIRDKRHSGSLVRRLTFIEQMKRDYPPVLARGEEPGVELPRMPAVH